VNGVVAILFVRRAAAATEPGVRDFLAALPSVLLGGLASRLAEGAWPVALEAAFVIAAAFTVVALLSLGRSFSIFPARRSLVERGPYALVRHPVYLGELAMVVVATAAIDARFALPSFFAMLLLLVPRIQREEKQLESDAAHASYRARVRSRLIPGIY
jgi:protein-S-isoprenylcysteine O-methyltransferase Ste14